MTTESTLTRIAAARPELSSEDGNAILGRVLSEPRTLAVDPRWELRPSHTRRTALLAGAGTVAVAAGFAGVALALSGGGAPSGKVVTPRISAPGGTTLRLASYSLKLPKSYRPADAASTPCYAETGVTWQPGPGSSNETEPSLAPLSRTDPSGVVQAASAAGGCISMLAYGPYTPGQGALPTFVGQQHARPVQVGPYEGSLGSWTLIGRSDTGTAYPPTTELSLVITVPAAGGQMEDLLVGSVGLSQSALVSIVSTGLSATGTSGAS